MSEIAISVSNVKIKYRMLKKLSFFKALTGGKKMVKTDYFEAVKGVSFDVEKGKMTDRTQRNCVHEKSD